MTDVVALGFSIFLLVGTGVAFSCRPAFPSAGDEPRAFGAVWAEPVVKDGGAQIETKAARAQMGAREFWKNEGQEIKERCRSVFVSELCAFIGNAGPSATAAGSILKFRQVCIISYDGTFMARNCEERSLKSQSKIPVSWEAMGSSADAGQTSGGLLFIIIEFVEGMDVPELLAAHPRNSA